MPYRNPDIQRAYSRKWIAARRAEYFKDKVCAWCGLSVDLSLHHIDRTSKVSHKIWSWTEDRRLRELAKCVVLCRSCHSKHHADEMKRWTHGLASTYKKGCRCSPCLHAQYRTMRNRALDLNAECEAEET